MKTRHRLLAVFLWSFALSALAVLSAAPPARPPLDKAAEKWVQDTLKRMTLDEKVGQLLAPSIDAMVTSTDSDVWEKKLHLVRDLKVGAIHVFGGSEPMPAALLNPSYPAAGSVGRKGDPLAAATFLNRLQQASAIPLLTTADFEGGAGYILGGTTRLPRAMAIGATRDARLAFAAGELAATEAKAVGVRVDFYPIFDVNNNPRNPIINIRSFGEDVGLVTEMATAYMRGIQSVGVLATAKHFPGHGDTNVDTHLGLAKIDHPRDHLDKVELAPFRAAVDAGIDAVMSAHIILPALDPSPGIPATLSRPILTGVLRGEMGFDGLIFTDSMSMFAISKNFGDDRAAVMAVKAGVDFVLHSPDDDSAFRAIKAAVESGEIGREQIDRSVERILRVKARLGLHKAKLVDVNQVESSIGGRWHEAVNAEICEKAITLVKDERGQVPLKVARDANIVYLSVVDYPSGWREGAPSRAFIPALKKRWPNVTALEISDRTTPNELDMVKVLVRRADAVVAGVFVRIASYSGRMDLSPQAVSLLESVAADAGRPFVTVIFGNPYTAMALGKLPAQLLTYEFTDAMETAAVRAIAGETAIGGKLPITMPNMYPFGHGLVRAATTVAPVGGAPAQKTTAQGFDSAAAAEKAEAWPAAAAAAARANDPGIGSPKLLHEVKPSYTNAARDAKIQGVVALECVILPDGSVGDVRVVRSLDRVHGLDEQAVAAARQWRFTPGTKDGKPVAVHVTLELNFRLK
jgi:beta-N-acetylhexosaminidase